MRGLTRLIMMFAPMIINQITRYQRNKQRQQHRDTRYPMPDRREQRDRYPEEENQRSIFKRKAKTPPPPPVPKKPELSEEEKNFRLKEEEIMIDPEVLDDYDNVSAPSATVDTPLKVEDKEIEQSAPKVKSGTDHAAQEKQVDKASDLDLRDIFFDEDEEEQS